MEGGAGSTLEGSKEASEDSKGAPNEASNEGSEEALEKKLQERDKKIIELRMEGLSIGDVAQRTVTPSSPPGCTGEKSHAQLGSSETDGRKCPHQGKARRP